MTKGFGGNACCLMEEMLWVRLPLPFHEVLLFYHKRLLDVSDPKEEAMAGQSWVIVVLLRKITAKSGLQNDFTRVVRPNDISAKCDGAKTSKSRRTSRRLFRSFLLRLDLWDWKKVPVRKVLWLWRSTLLGKYDLSHRWLWTLMTIPCRSDIEPIGN